ncbi:MAG: hypothetical protein PVJ17_06040 [Lysobacterales bacterium]|jgi:hypothetical protein
MRAIHYTLIGATIIAVAGLAIAILLDQRQIGVSVFAVGYFLGAGSAVLRIIATPSEKLGRLGFAIKIGVAGFGVALLGPLLDFAIDAGSGIGDFIFNIGFVVILIGVVIGVVLEAKNRGL